MKTNITLLSIACMCASLISCQEVPYVFDNTPQVVGLAVEDVAAESCTLRAQISGDFDDVYFEYSEEPNFQSSNTVHAYYRNPFYISSIKGLEPGTQYYFRCVLTNKRYSDQEYTSFTDKFTTDTRYRQYIYWNQKTEYYLDTKEIELTAKASSGLAVSYRVTDGNNVVSVEGNWLKVKSNGTAVVEAYQEGNDMYYPAEPVSKVFEIEDNKLIITDVDVDHWQTGGSNNWQVEI